jgi:hypothetical protein
LILVLNIHIFCVDGHVTTVNVQQCVNNKEAVQCDVLLQHEPLIILSVVLVFSGSPVSYHEHWVFSEHDRNSFVYVKLMFDWTKYYVDQVVGILC